MNDVNSFLLATAQDNSVMVKATHQALVGSACTPHGHGANAAQLGFSGQLCERLAPYYLLGHGYRAYIPALMRFNQPDAFSPFGAGGLNSYVYCVGDPVNFGDLSGRMPKPLGSLVKVGSVGERSAKAAQRLQRARNARNARYAKKNAQKLVEYRKATKLKNTADLDKFDDLERGGYLKGKYTDFPTLPSWHNAEHAQKIVAGANAAGANLAHGRPNMNKVNLYRQSAEHPWVLDTAEIEAYRILTMSTAKSRNAKFDIFNGVRWRGENIRKRYIVKHYNNEYIGTHASLEGTIYGENGSMWWSRQSG